MRQLRYLGRTSVRSLLGCLCLATAGFLPATPAHAQRVLVVGAGGQFTTIPPAIQAATAGDVVIVRSGTYAGFTLDRGITVIGEGAALVSQPTTPHISVTNVPAGQRAVVRGGFSSLSGLHIGLRANSGHVHVEGLSGLVTATNCAHLTLRGHDTTGTPAMLTLTGSKALLQQCQLAASGGIQVANSDVAIAESTVRGVDAIFLPGPAVALQGGTLTVAGAADTVLAAATTSSQPAIEVAGGTVVLEPAVTLLPSGSAPPVRGGTVITTRVPSVRLDRGTNGFTTRLHAPGALTGYTVLSLALPGSMPLPFGDLWLDPLLHYVIDGGTMPPSGFRTSSVALPALPGFAIAVQGVVVQPAGLQLSTAAIVTL